VARTHFTCYEVLEHQIHVLGDRHSLLCGTKFASGGAESDGLALRAFRFDIVGRIEVSSDLVGLVEILVGSLCRPCVQLAAQSLQWGAWPDRGLSCALQDLQGQGRLPSLWPEAASCALSLQVLLLVPSAFEQDK